MAELEVSEENDVQGNAPFSRSMRPWLVTIMILEL